MHPMRLEFLLSFLALMLLGEPAFAQGDYGIDDEAFADDDEQPDMDFTDNSKKNSKTPRKKPSAGLREGGLQVTRHSMTFGGRIGFTFDTKIEENTRVDATVNPPVTLTTKETSGGGSFTFAPEFGYFIIDKLELLVSIGVNLPFGTSTYDEDHMAGQTYRNYALKEVFFDLGLRYLFDLKVLYFYLGFRVGMKYNTLYSVLLSLPMGILVPFNEHVALDVGLRFNVDIGVGDNDVSWIHIPMAYFGVQGFFNFFE